MVDEVRRRVRRRVSGRRGGLSDSTTSEGGNVASLNSDVEGMTTRPVTTPLSESESAVGSRTDAPADFTPANRMKEVRDSSRATAYEKEYRLKLLHRMLMRNVPLDQIAKELDVSVRTVMRDRKDLYKALGKGAQDLDVNVLIGDTMAFYGEVQGMGLRAASASKAPLNMRLAAMRTALASKNDMHRFLSNVGVYDVLKFQAGEKNGNNDLEKLVNITEAILADNDDTLDPMQSIANVGLLEEEEDIHLL